MEVLGNYPSKLDDTITTKERSWMGALLAWVNKEFPTRPTYNPTWCIRIEDVEFQSWWRSQGKVTIFFNGASKGNLGISGVGGVVYSQDGSHIDRYSWGLGKSTNNHAKLVGLLKGYQIA